MHNSDLTVSLLSNDIKFHQTFSEDWNVTLVDTGLNTGTAGRLKKIKGCGEWKRSFFKIGNWWEEMTEPISNKSARRKLKQQLKNKGL